MVRRLIRNQLPRKGLRVRAPCPPLSPTLLGKDEHDRELFRKRSSRFFYGPKGDRAAQRRLYAVADPSLLARSDLHSDAIR